MRKIFILLLLSVPEGCLAQFNTLYPKWHKNIAVAKSDCEVTSVMVGEENASSKAPVRMCHADSVREECMNRYLSVSPPLESLGISSRFGMRRDPFNHKRKCLHNGLDLKVPTGTTVHAMFAGKVVRVSSDKRSGNYVTLQHGDYTISYCHLSRTLVSEGDYVKAGDVVALSGNTGRSTGSHLHISCKRKGRYVNPAYLIEYVIDVRTKALEELNSLLG